MARRFLIAAGNLALVLLPSALIGFGVGVFVFCVLSLALGMP